MTIVRPVWADPGFLLGQTFSRCRLAPAVAAGGGLVLTADPSRFAFGISVVDAGGLASNTQIRATNEPGSSGFLISQDALWFTLFTHGTFVCGEWYLNKDPGATLTIYECLIQSGGG